MKRRSLGKLKRMAAPYTKYKKTPYKYPDRLNEKAAFARSAPREPAAK